MLTFAAAALYAQPTSQIVVVQGKVVDRVPVLAW
jgi:hypothetical protein